MRNQQSSMYWFLPWCLRRWFLQSLSKIPGAGLKIILINRLAKCILPRSMIIDRRIMGIKRTAQSILEYTMLIVVVSAALIAMQKYINRSVNARLKQIQVELNERLR